MNMVPKSLNMPELYYTGTCDHGDTFFHFFPILPWLQNQLSLCTPGRSCKASDILIHLPSDQVNTKSSDVLISTSQRGANVSSTKRIVAHHRPNKETYEYESTDFGLINGMFA